MNWPYELGASGPVLYALVAFVGALARAAPPPSREEVMAETLHSYDGASVRGVDTSTLKRKVICGYQGWFNCDGDVPIEVGCTGQKAVGRWFRAVQSSISGRT